ncbi:dTDP-glucose 4,6-dehydratase [Ornithinibacillus sp. 179-J 7C1 HS]|uniref:dTDP-glucose 4,6-dehydratase n=1 Tax=Ornithinibacillus sp. 179-J 7C1 HS TaxID=3142384 RepID=UPI00399F8576
MNVLVTGGAGFIGRWVVKCLLEDGHQITVLDNLTNGRKQNLTEFEKFPNYQGLIIGDIKDRTLLEDVFKQSFDICYHLAASINVQDSIDHPRTTFDNDVVGTFHLLECCRKQKVKLIFMSTCMVYDRALGGEGIQEIDPIKPASPYAGSKLAAEQLVLSYYYAYNLPVTILRPFNTYGPFQKTTGEGGVVSIFIKKKLANQDLQIYGDGKQTRDLLYVEDCARFVVEAGYNESVEGEVIHAGLGKDISIEELAKLIESDHTKIKYVPHIHPQSEIPKLLCDYSKAKDLLGWEPTYTLEQGIKKTEEWIRLNS